jgi:hypothetical protein
METTIDTQTPAPEKRVPRAPNPDWRPAFLEELGKRCNVAASCRAAKVDRKTVYVRRNTDDEFAEAWKEALEEGIEALELEARRRAEEGTLKPVFHKGEKCGEVQEYSDTLMIFLLKAARPDVYRERHLIEQEGTVRLELTEEIVSSENRLQNHRVAPSSG